MTSTIIGIGTLKSITRSWSINMIIKQDFYFKSLAANRPLHIRVPDRGEPPYPVMYFFDGHNLFRDADATYGKSWGLDEYCSNWDKPIIIVGIECGHEGNVRLSEYLPCAADSAEWLKGVEPLGERTMQGIVQELKPFIDDRFPTIPFRECTGIAGSSMGGLMAAYAVLKYNDCFSKAACVSPSLLPVRDSLFRELYRANLSADTRVFLSWGTREGFDIDPDRADTSSPIYRACREFGDRIVQRGGVAGLYCQVGGRHCEADWERQLGLFMPFLWQQGEVPFQ